MSKQYKTLAVVLVGVLVLVGAVYAFMEYQRNKPTTPVRDLTVEVSAGEHTQEIPPYTICELDQECDGGEPPTFALGSADGAGDSGASGGEVKVKVPDEIASISWRLLLVYDDPAENSEQIFQSGEANETTFAPVTESGARIVVAEVTTLDIDKGDDGEEIPVIATWSVAFD